MGYPFRFKLCFLCLAGRCLLLGLLMQLEVRDVDRRFLLNNPTLGIVLTLPEMFLYVVEALDNGALGLRPMYHPNYYGAFVLDADGHNIEAVCHAPEP